MPRELLKYLEDIRLSCYYIIKHTSKLSKEQYNSDIVIRSFVERQLEIIGEALKQAKTIDNRIGESISGLKDIINFRNRIAHGYFDISNEIVWEIVQNDLLLLEKEVIKLLK